MNWSYGEAFERAMVVTGVGVYAGNAGGSAPAHTAVIDYFFNTASPIVPEDPNGAVLLTIDITGGGSVQRNPDRASYSPDETVELTAVPDPGWSFVGWGGAASGSQNPLQVVISENLNITATFEVEDDTTPPALSNISSGAPAASQATISWSTDEPATTWVSYGLTAGYEEGEAGNDVLTTLHAVTLSGLTPDTEYYYRVRSVDAAGNAATSGDLVFTTVAEGGSGGSVIASDEFSASALDTGIWALVDPVGDAGLTMTGTQASLSVPAGVSHDLWTSGNQAPRLLQAAPDSDFEVEVKFDRMASQKFQMQGILVEQDADHYLRFGSYFDGSAVRLFTASLWAGTAQVRGSRVIGGSAPLYMRVKRSGSQWTHSYSFDGINWQSPHTFSFPMTVTAAGVYAGNAGTSPPAFTALIDYFRHVISAP
jgi:regulation of enolase protein 1 (concanavalin A-like superfamily)